MNYDEIKKECQLITHNWIVGIKFVTIETVDEVKSSIKRDLNIYDNICRFIIFDNCIELGLETNAKPALYYFTEYSKIFEEVLVFLKEICKEEKLGFTGIRGY